MIKIAALHLAKYIHEKHSFTSIVMRDRNAKISGLLAVEAGRE